MIHAEYDREADALYVRIADGDVAQSVEVDDHRVVDVDDRGVAVGLEVLYPAMNLRIGKLAAQFGFADRLSEIDDAVAEALGRFPAHRVTMAIQFVIPEKYPISEPEPAFRSSDTSAPRPVELV